MKKFLTVLFALLAAGCATGPIYQAAPPPENGKALVYIYRVGGFTFSAADAAFYLNNTRVAVLNNDGYTWLHPPAGKYIFRQEWSHQAGRIVDMDIELLPGRTYFYRLDASSNILISAKLTWRLTQVPENQALAEINSSRFQPSLGVEKVMPRQ